MSQVNVIVIHVRAEQAPEYEKLFAERELPRWRDYHARGKFVSARFFRSEFGTDDRSSLAKYVIVVEVPSMAEHAEHDADPDFREFDEPRRPVPAGASTGLRRRPHPLGRLTR